MRIWYLAYIILGLFSCKNVENLEKQSQNPNPKDALTGTPVQISEGDPSTLNIADQETELSQLQKLLDQTVAQNNRRGGGIFQVSTPHKMLWKGVSGSLSKNGTPMKLDSTFEIASITKAFVATVIMQLAEEKKLGLSDDISKYLSETVMKDLAGFEEITIEELLSHTSGLPDFWWDPGTNGDSENQFMVAFLNDPNHDWSPQETLSYIPTLEPINSPGKQFHYSDTNFVLAGLIIEKVEGTALEKVLHKRIFTPLGMSVTYFSYHENPPSSIPESHRYESSLDLYHRKNQSADWASGGLVSSTSDLEKFIFALSSGKLFSFSATLQKMKNWITTGSEDVYYGLGLFCVQLSDSEGDLWGHDGYGNSFMYYWPKHEVAFIGTLNQTETDWWPLVEKAVEIIDD